MNPPLEVGARLGEHQTSGTDGFDAFGKPVSNYRKSAALRHLRAMVPDTNTEEATGCINRMVEAVERDDPYRAMEAARRTVDLTGAYRLLAVLLCAEDDNG